MTRLIEAIEDVSRFIVAGTRQHFPAPRPYPEMPHLGARWMHVGRYWFSFRAEPGGFVVTSLIFDGANIPARINPDDI